VRLSPGRSRRQCAPWRAPTWWPAAGSVPSHVDAGVADTHSERRPARTFVRDRTLARTVVRVNALREQVFAQAEQMCYDAPVLTRFDRCRDASQRATLTGIGRQISV